MLPIEQTLEITKILRLHYGEYYYANSLKYKLCSIIHHHLQIFLTAIAVYLSHRAYYLNLFIPCLKKQITFHQNTKN